MGATMTKNLSYILLSEDRSASSGMTKMAAVGQKATALIGGAFTKLGGVIGGEFGGVLTEAGNGIDQFGQHGATMGQKLEVAGGIIAGIGGALTLMGSKEKQASDQLQQSVKNTGGSWNAYKDQVEKAIGAAENFDHNAVDTQTALAKLTNATGSTADALKYMQVVEDLAATKHISLADASEMVIKILAGKGQKTLTDYGITAVKVTTVLKAQQSAQTAVTKASTTLATKQEALKLVHESLAGKTKLTTAEHVRLEKAQYSVSQASAVLKAAQEKSAAAQKAAKDATASNEQALNQLSTKLKGQAAASVNNFGSQVDIVKTKILDWADGVANTIGPALGVLGTVVGIAGTGLQLYQARQEALIAKEVVATAVITDETAAQVGLNAAMDINPIVAVGGAIVALGAVLGGAAFVNQQNMTQGVENYTQALREDNGVIGENTRAMAANDLLKSGALKAANSLGISTYTLVSATLGNKKALNEVNDALARHKGALDATVASTIVAARPGLVVTQKKARDAIDTVTSALGTETAQLKNSTAGQKLYNTAVGDANAKLAVLIAREKELNLTMSNSQSQHQNRTSVPLPKKPHKKGALGGLYTSETDITIGESGPELLAPLWKLQGQSGSSGLHVHVHVTGSVHASEASLAKAVASAVIGQSRTGHFDAVGFKKALGI